MFDELARPIIQAIGVGLGVALLAVLKKLFEKFNYQLSAERQGQLEHFAKLGIGYAEELALRKLKDIGVKMEGDEKHAKAIEYLVAKLPRVDMVEAEKIITALLPDKRAAAGQITSAVVEMGKAVATAEVRSATPAQQ